MASRVGRPGGTRPTFWVAPLEAGGCPLLSPPNVIHCVLTTRDCVMVEERRLSSRSSTRCTISKTERNGGANPRCNTVSFAKSSPGRNDVASPPRSPPRRDARGAKGAGVRRGDVRARRRGGGVGARDGQSRTLSLRVGPIRARRNHSRADVRSATAAERTWAREGASERARAAEKAASSGSEDGARAAALLRAMRVGERKTCTGSARSGAATARRSARWYTRRVARDGVQRAPPRRRRRWIGERCDARSKTVTSTRSAREMARVKVHETDDVRGYS